MLQSPMGAVCVAFIYGNGERLSPQAASSLHREFPALWVLWFSGHLGSNQIKGSLEQRGISNFPPRSMLLPSFLQKQTRAFKVTDYTWL